VAMIDDSSVKVGKPESDVLTALDTRTREVIAGNRSDFRTTHRWPLRRALLAADVLALLVSFAISEIAFRPADSLGTQGQPLLEFIFFLLLLPIWIVVANLYGLYGRDESRPGYGTVDDIAGVFHMVSAGLAVLVIIGSATSVIDPSISRIVIFWIIAFATVIFTRAATRTLWRHRARYLQNAIIIGAGNVGQLAARKLLKHPEYGVNVVGFADDEPRVLRPELAHLPVLGSTIEIGEIVRGFKIDRVIIAFNREPHEQTLALIRSVVDLGVRVDIVPRLFDLVGSDVRVHSVEGLPFMGLHQPRLSRSARFIKRMVDVIGAVGTLVFFAPLLGVIALRIRSEASGPVLFRQTRAGVNGRPFTMYKFRTMTVDADERKGEYAHLNVHRNEGPGPWLFKIPHDPRVTPFGAFLRRYSLDELPQLVNVLRGEMSLVGPRPLIPEEAQHITAWARKRLDLKPGVTGLWQVLGRSDIPFDEMTKLDYLYVTNWSLLGDLRLLFLTVPAVLRSPRVD